MHETPGDLSRLEVSGRRKALARFYAGEADAPAGRVLRRCSFTPPLRARRIWRGFTEIRNQQIKLRRYPAVFTTI